MRRRLENMVLFATRARTQMSQHIDARRSRSIRPLRMSMFFSIGLHVCTLDWPQEREDRLCYMEANQRSLKLNPLLCPPALLSTSIISNGPMPRHRKENCQKTIELGLCVFWPPICAIRRLFLRYDIQFQTNWWRDAVGMAILEPNV